MRLRKVMWAVTLKIPLCWRYTTGSVMYLNEWIITYIQTHVHKLLCEATTVNKQNLMHPACQYTLNSKPTTGTTRMNKQILSKLWRWSFLRAKSPLKYAVTCLIRMHESLRKMSLLIWCGSAEPEWIIAKTIQNLKSLPDIKGYFSWDLEGYWLLLKNYKVGSVF